jgi:hypothetical protein
MGSGFVGTEERQAKTNLPPVASGIHRPDSYRQRKCGTSQRVF